MKTEIHPLRVLVKALLLFVAINIVYALVDPPVSELSAYNLLFPGRVRMSFGDVSDPYVVMIDNVDAMFASHAISKPKTPEEYRVVVIGDSSVWGEGVQVGESISEQFDNLNIQCDGRVVKTYNLGYPHPSVIKDLVILDKAVETDPDLIIWFVTLNTLIPRRLSPFLAANSERVANMLNLYDIPFVQEDALDTAPPGFYDKTLIGQRSYLARWIKLQFLGVLWAATGTDIETSPNKASEVLSQNVKNDTSYRGLKPGANIKDMMLFNALVAGHKIAGQTPILIVNEPIFIASGKNSAVRYNDGYPRWAFDDYRAALAAESSIAQWNYIDLWDAVPSKYFSDTGLHLADGGERTLAEKINPTVQQFACH